MNGIAITKADLIRALVTERDWWRAMLDLAAQDGALTGDEAIDGNWTLNELLAHINGWRAWTLARLEAAADGSDSPTTPWPAPMSEATEAGVDEINAWFTAESHGTTLPGQVRRLNSQLDGLEAVVERMPAEDLLVPGRFGWLGEGAEPLPIGPALIGYSITHVHKDHATTLETWLTVRLGQHPEFPPAPTNFGFED